MRESASCSFSFEAFKDASKRDPLDVCTPCSSSWSSAGNAAAGIFTFGSCCPATIHEPNPLDHQLSKSATDVTTNATDQRDADFSYSPTPARHDPVLGVISHLTHLDGLNGHAWDLLGAASVSDPTRPVPRVLLATPFHTSR